MASESNAGLMNEDELRAYATSLETKLDRIQMICETTDFIGTDLSNALLKVIAND